jgi:hypothetical protein
MWSYPGLIPLSASKVKQIEEAVEPVEFDRIFGAWWDLHIEESAKVVLAGSVRWYLAALHD